MKPASRHLTALAAGTVALLLLTGCGKNADEASGETTPVAAQPDQAPPVPGAKAPAQSSVPAARLAESQAAINSGDFERAATALVAAQQAQLTQQQAEALARQMQQLQGSLAGAVANGDPRAKAAADKLRQSATVR